LATQFSAWGEPGYRVDQVLGWLYARHATSWAGMTDLPRALRARLAERFTLTPLELVRCQGAQDATQKFLWRLADGAFVESVLIPANPALYGEPSDRRTLCVSTQVGCAYGCRFCASGLEGWKRHLRVEEIVDQVLALERWHLQASGREAARARTTPGPHPAGGAAAPATEPSAPRSRWIQNLVVMGMGEPLANYGSLLQALRILNAPWGGGVGARKITISTSGLVPQIRRLAEEDCQFRLAISLHAATDVLRSRLMPINRKYPLRELMAACEYYLSRRGRLITFEYILLAGVNDGLDQVRPLTRLARRLSAKVNLIPYNAVEGLPWTRPTETAQEAFLQALTRQGVAATLRREKGHDIEAACGQLRLRTERGQA
jgi:23S rRNA (adenine2503-C2)-methyltransferase